MNKPNDRAEPTKFECFFLNYGYNNLSCLLNLTSLWSTRLGLNIFILTIQISPLNIYTQFKQFHTIHGDQ